MTIRSTFALAFAASLWLSGAAACTNNGDDDESGDSGDSGDNGDSGDSGDNGDNGDSGDGPSGDDADPRSGEWDYTEWVANRNDCDLDENYGNGGGNFGLDNNGDGTFTVIPGDGSDPFDCDIDGDSFDCPNRATAEEPIQGGYDATLVGQAVADGSFATDERASGTQTATVNCDGSDCALAETALGIEFPCTLEVDFVIEYVGGI